MSDWPKSTTRWFLVDDRPGLLIPDGGSRKGMLAALAQLGRSAGMCMTGNQDGTTCYQSTPCEAHPSPTPGKVAG